MSIIEILRSLPNIPPYKTGTIYSVTNYDGTTEASSSKWCLNQYARFCHVFKFITEKISDDGYNVVYWLSHPVFAMKLEGNYPQFKIFMGREGFRNDERLNELGECRPPRNCEWAPFVRGQSIGVQYAKDTKNYALHLTIILHYAADYIYYLKHIEDKPADLPVGWVLAKFQMPTREDKQYLVSLEPDEFGHSEVMVADYTMGVFTVEPNTELKGVVKWMEIPE